MSVGLEASSKGQGVALGESIGELLKEGFGFLLKLDNLVFDHFLSLKFLLDLGVELSINEDSLPCDFVRVNVDTFSTHEVAFPLAFIGRAVCVVHFTKAMHDAFVEFSSVFVARGELVGTLAVHLVVNPVAVVFLHADLVSR